jgi:hypothetical protein
VPAPLQNTPTIPNTSVHTEHRGWKLQARWLHSLTASTEGWVCYATRPASSHGLNIGRWTSSDIALEQGRAYVDLKLEAPQPAGARPNVPKRWP